MPHKVRKKTKMIFIIGEFKKIGKAHNKIGNDSLI